VRNKTAMIVILQNGWRIVASCGLPNRLTQRRVRCVC